MEAGARVSATCARLVSALYQRLRSARKEERRSLRENRVLYCSGKRSVAHRCHVVGRAAAADRLLRRLPRVPSEHPLIVVKHDEVTLDLAETGAAEMGAQAGNASVQGTERNNGCASNGSSASRLSLLGGA